jgi:urease accessory protein
MLVIERHATPDAVPTERLLMAFELRCKCRLRTRTESGEDVGLFLARGEVLHHGDKLAANDGRTVEVVAAPEALMEARAADPLLLARAAYHLGNRHVAVQIGEGWLRFAIDHVLGDMAAGLGMEVVEIAAPFEPEAGAYGHGHTHGGETTFGAKLHLYQGPQ